MASNSLRADHPLSLIPTLHAQTGKDDLFNNIASQMTLVHNVIIRGYNSIYLQAPNIKDTDVPDFLHYCMAFYNIVESHHAGEEEVLFPNIEKDSGVKGVMDEEFEEHRTFSTGLHRFKSYIDSSLASPSSFKSVELTEILDSFGPALQSHLEHEPPKLASLEQYRIDIESISEKTADHTMKMVSTINTLPFLWYNLDRDFEGGRWANFPEVPAPIKWVMINILGWWRGTWWRFGSCGADGVQRDLLFLTKRYAD